MQETNPVPQQKDKPWYKQGWGVVLIILSVLTFTWPIVLLILLWQSKWKTRTKVLFTVSPLLLLPVLVIFIGILAVVNDPSLSENNKEPASTSAEITQQEQPEQPRQQLNANVAYGSVVITIQNNETVPWGRCKYKLNNKYDYKGRNVIIPANQPVELPFADFVDGNNKRFNIFEEKPDYLKISCYRDGTEFSDGDYFFQ